MNPKDLRTKYLSGDFLLKGEFQGGDYKREETLTRCERYAGWTLPNIFPDDPLNEYDEMQNDYQSVGAQSVINLANKIMMALFQPSKPFFRLNLTQEQQQEVVDSGFDAKDIDKKLADAEREAMRELEKLNSRVVLTEAITHLIITGNALVYMPEEGNLQYYSLRDYTLKRDLRGNLVKLIMREVKSVSGLSDELAALAQSEGYEDADEVSIYTCVQRVGKDKFLVWQELEDMCYCHKQIGVYKESELPWIPLAWNLCRNKDYGTGLVENYAGDFHTLSTLAEAILDYTVVATDIKILVDPTGQTDVRQITEAASGDYVHGKEEDIFVHAANVSNITDFLTRQFESVERRIARAFLLNSSVTRDAERVTAEEIRMQAHELEGSLGGVYSRLAVELQQPLAARQLEKIDPIFKEVEPVIITGLESLSRNSELDRFRLFLQDLALLAELPEQTQKLLDMEATIGVLGAGHGVDYEKVLKDEKQIKADEAAEADQLADAAGKEAGAIAAAQGQTQ